MCMNDATPIFDFPFKSILSLHLLIDYWEKAIATGHVPFGQPLLEHIQRAPELIRDIESLLQLQ